MVQRTLSVLNTGSSSLKFAVFHVDVNREPRLLRRGSVDRIGGRAKLIAKQSDGSPDIEQDVDVADHAAALQCLERMPDGPFTGGQTAGFGHRIVHGGPEFDGPVLVQGQTLQRIEALESLAPLHNPPAVGVLRALMARFPRVPQVACFDTVFHRGHPAVADRFAIPDQFYREGVRRYGFHGLSYEFIARRLGEVAPETASGRVVIAHLGSGASMCALAGGRSVESSMSFSALDGLPMATRPGSLDPGVILWLQRQKGWSVDRVERWLYEECGLHGLSGISGDIRALLASDAPLAQLAVEYFVHHIARTAAALACGMGGIDGFVFTAGIGEHSAEIRARVLQRLHWLGVRIDHETNHSGGPRLTLPQSTLPAYVIPTDEESVIARHALGLLDFA